jgi:subtilisin-like proprotein convertase family protein
MRTRSMSVVGLITAAGLATAAVAQNHPEIEPNNTKGDALFHGPFVLGAGHSISGTSAAATDPDYFLIKTAPAQLGVYRHRLVLSSNTPGHTVNIRGTGQIAAAAGAWPCASGTPSGTDTVAQTALTDGSLRTVQWYGFGKGEELFYRVAGTTSTTAEYMAVLETAPVTPMNLGTFMPGEITITQVNQGHSGDGDMWVYDSNLNAIIGYGNDGSSTNGGAPTNSLAPVHLRRNYEPGVYYIAMTNFNLANDQSSPCDDGYRTGTILDFPDSVLSSTTTTNINLAFAMIDGQGVTPVPATKAEAFEVLWFRFEVGGVAEMGRCCLPSGACEIRSPLACTTGGGAYGGANTDCAGFVCPQPGACCFADLSCQILSEAQCAAAAGNYLGNGTACGTCPPPPPGTYIWSGELPIPDGISNGVCGDLAVVEFNVTEAAVVNSASIGVHITHGWQGDIRFELRHVESNTVVTLTDRPGVGVGGSLFGFSTANYGTSSSNIFRLIDTATSPYHNPPLTSGIANVAGNWLALTPLAAFNGVTAAGTWRLEVQDCADAFIGQVRFAILQLELGAVCYANCDGSTIEPVLNVDDFTCFINEFASAQGLPPNQQQTSYANCDGSTVEPMLNVDDFTCFINEFAAGCR